MIKTLLQDFIQIKNSHFQFFIMRSPSSISVTNSYTLSHDYKAINLKVLFIYKFEFQITDYDMINKYVIHMFNLYKFANNEDFNF